MSWVSFKVFNSLVKYDPIMFQKWRTNSKEYPVGPGPFSPPQLHTALFTSFPIEVVSKLSFWISKIRLSKLLWILSTTPEFFLYLA